MLTQTRRPILIVSNVLLTNDNKVLLGLRADNHTWEFPGGHVEDEFICEAAYREQEEETGMKLQSFPEILRYTEEDSVDGNRYFVVHMLWTNWEGFPRVMEPDECLGWQWFPLKDLPKNVANKTKKVIEILNSTEKWSGEDIT